MSKAILVLSLVMLPIGCSKEAGRPADGRTLKVLCSVYPIYLFTMEVAGGVPDVQVELMLPAELGCAHGYALTPQDMQKIAGADIFVANGLGLEEYLGRPLQRANQKIQVLDSSAGLGDLIQMEEEEHHEEHQAPEHHRHVGPNPHLFASPRMAAKIVRNIAAQLGAIDPANAEAYRQNADRYAATLEELAEQFAAALKDAHSRSIVTEHAVFDYLARDCGLEIVAVIEEAPGQEPSAAKMLELVKMIRDSGAAAVFTEPQYPPGVGRTIAAEVGVPVEVLDPVATGPQDPPAEYYEKTMRANLDKLVHVLKP